LTANTTAPQSVLQMIARNDEHTALHEPQSGLRLSYAELHEAIADCAGRLAFVGVSPGDRVGLSFPNSIAFLVTFLAVVELGAAAAPLNGALGEREVAEELTDLAATRLLYAAENEGAASAARALGIPTNLISVVGNRIEVEHATGLSVAGSSDADSIALLLHTSGTTSRPKTVPIRQRNLSASTATIVATYGLNGDDITYCVMPLFHVHGLVAATLGTLASGGTIVIPPRFSASGFWDDVLESGSTWYTAVPTIHSLVLNKAAEMEATPSHNLRFVRSCSAPLPAPEWRRYEDRIEVPLVEAYGMTEAAHQMSSNPLPPHDRRAGTVGIATGIEIALLDDDWNEVPVGERGEVSVRGSSIVDGYLNNPEANEANFKNGWFRTGDVGTKSEDGYLTLVGRTKELINRAGEKVSPYEVEAVLLEHPAVSEAAAYPIPHPIYGETVGAVVVLRSEVSQADLLAHCAKALAPFKVPTAIAVLPEIPKGPTGKVQRRNLADLVK
jgi:acyl-CoA synthetase (AMP-forming)/AMP-acid ligase II